MTQAQAGAGDQDPPWIARQTRELLGRRGHAWLLQGASGLGQYRLALALARAWLCETPSADGACGHCASCHAVDVGTHADLCLLMPETTMLTLGWALSDKAQQEIDDKSRKPSKEIRVEAMRDAVGFAQRTNARGRGKVVLVYPAERMNHVTANTLLKTLEEPPGDLRFVLGTEAAHQLLPTIRSRCLTHTMQWPPAGESVAWLQGQGVAAADAPVLLHAAGARPEDAIRWAQAGRNARQWAQLPKALVRGDGSVLADWTAAETVGVLQKLCHDLAVLRTGAAPRYFDRADLPKPPSAQVLGTWWRELGRTARTVEHPFQAGLMMEMLVSQARTALNSGTESP